MSAQRALGLLAFALLLAAVVLPYLLGSEGRCTALPLTLLLVALAFVACGVSVGAGIWGVFVDSRNRVSLSRMQIAIWTTVLLGGYLAAVMSNIARGDSDPTNVTIPTGLLVLAGIATVSMVTSPAIKAQQSKEPPSPAGPGLSSADTGDSELSAQAVKAGRRVRSVAARGRIAVNVDVRDANWTDMIKGEQLGNFATVDIGKTQLVLVTFVAVCVYVSALWRLFCDPDIAFIGSLPELSDGLNVLLGISHTGYIASKMTTRDPAPPRVPPSRLLEEQ